MLFNSIEFLFFFPIVTLFFFLIPHKFRWLFLLLASCFFYMYFKAIYIFILVFTIILDYRLGILIENSSTPKRRKQLLVISIVANVAVLAAFKYYNFFSENLNSLCDAVGMQAHLPYLSLVIPIGLSFHTFQAMSYTIEVYRGHQQAEKKAGLYALYILFYPQVIAGPIERPQHLLPQLKEKQTVDYARITSGLKLMAWGLFKKVVIADRLAILVNTVYQYPQQHGSLSLIIATVFFAFQIFCDFSGYSDMAIGAARVMGFKLMTNFNQPYQAKTIREFWKRWHISLSTWFRDYLYISLGGKNVSIPRWYLNIFIVFLISGLWHGAAWTFLIWGALHAFYMITAHVTQKQREKLNRLLLLEKIWFLPVLITFSLVSFAWIFFRAASISDACYIVTHLFSDGWNIFQLSSLKNVVNLGLDTTQFLIAIAAIVLMEYVHYLQRTRNLSAFIESKNTLTRWCIYYGIVMAICLFGIFQKHQFIYYQF